MKDLADGLKPLAVSDTAFRDAVLGVSIAGEKGGTRLVAEFPKGATIGEACNLYLKLAQQANGLVSTTIIRTGDN